MAESSLDRYVLEGMKPFWRGGMKHNDLTPGVSDLSGFIPGTGTVWIEDKALRDWPKRPGTRVWLDYREDQRLFTYEHRGWLLLRCGRDYLLFNFEQAQRVEGSTQGQIFGARAALWTGSIVWKEFAECVRQRFG